MLSCGPKEQVNTKDTMVQNDTVPKQEFVPKKIYAGIRCKTDERFSYALYLPANFTENKKYPYVLFFDAHASGTLPLEKYSALADQYDFILVASNESKNGIAPALYADIKNALDAEVKSY
jgi:predicted peptidase